MFLYLAKDDERVLRLGYFYGVWAQLLCTNTRILKKYHKKHKINNKFFKYSSKKSINTVNLLVKP